MNPAFLQIGNFTIAWYGVLITLGIVAGVWVGTRMARERGLNVDLFNDMILWMIVWGLVGARLVFVATSWNQFENIPFPRVLLDIVNLRQGGISIHGGLIGGILVMLYYARRKGMDFYRYADLCVPGVAFGIIGGRIGNIMNGTDTVGRVTGWPIGFHWPAGARAFHGHLPMIPPEHLESHPVRQLVRINYVHDRFGLGFAHGGAAAARARCRPRAHAHPRAVRHVAGHRAGPARGQGVPHRPPRRLQRPDADGNARGLRNGPGARRRAAAARGRDRKSTRLNSSHRT